MDNVPYFEHRPVLQGQVHGDSRVLLQVSDHPLVFRKALPGFSLRRVVFMHGELGARAPGQFTGQAVVVGVGMGIEYVTAFEIVFIEQGEVNVKIVVRVHHGRLPGVLAGKYV
jgi:hypothetical protein